MSEPITTCLAAWHRYISGESETGLDALIHDDCVFLSPIVFTPQVGKAITMMYLGAAAQTLGNDSFRYVREIQQGNQAMLEFETEIEGIAVNGVDIITCDDDGLITEFKVMVRPLKAINAVHASMMAMLEQMQGR